MRLVLILLWCLRWLPPRVVRVLGRALGGVLFRFGRRRVTLVNLKKCFPHLSETEREAIGLGVFRNLGASALELGRLWYAPIDVALANVKAVDFRHIDRLRGTHPIIVLAPHFVGLEFAGARFSREYEEVFSMYSVQKNRVFDRALRRARQRWNGAELVTRQQGLKPVLKSLKAKRMFYYLPDMDFGARDAVFADFFGVRTATVTALSRLCEITGAKVVPMIARMTTDGYEVRCYPPWENFPSGDLAADARRMNAFIEERIREMPDQYFWVHKRFKTRPPGEPGFYD
jgi:Kdo2-lipid IVA lauroyltransferase/acyltransferase